MASFHDLTTAQLKQALQIKEQIESLQEKLSSLLGGSSSGPTNGKRTVSAATKKKMAAAQQARYAKLKTPAAHAPTTPKKPATATAAPKKRKVSPETKAKLAAAMKARWAARKKGAPAPNAAKEIK